MFRHQMCHPQGACFVTLLNHIITIAAIAKINEVFKTLKLSSVLKWLLLRIGQAQQQHQHTDCIYGHQTDFI